MSSFKNMFVAFFLTVQFISIIYGLFRSQIRFFIHFYFEFLYCPCFVRIHFVTREIVIIVLFCLFLVSYLFLSHFIYIWIVLL